MPPTREQAEQLARGGARTARPAIAPPPGCPITTSRSTAANSSISMKEAKGCPTRFCVGRGGRVGDGRSGVYYQCLRGDSEHLALFEREAFAVCDTRGRNWICYPIPRRKVENLSMVAHVADVSEADAPATKAD